MEAQLPFIPSTVSGYVGWYEWVLEMIYISVTIPVICEIVPFSAYEPLTRDTRIARFAIKSTY